MVFNKGRKMSSFHIDSRVSVKLEYDFAMKLGEFILTSGTEDKKFLALGHKLARMDEEEEQPVMRQYRQGRPWDKYHEYNSTNENWQKHEEKTLNEITPPIRIRKSNFIKK